MESQVQLLSMISDENIIEAINMPKECSIDEILDGRDSEDFSGGWMDVFTSIESLKDRMSSCQVDLSTQIREAAYLRSYARWHSPDLAAYISDDFGLIADASALGINDAWIIALLQSYKNGLFPSSTNTSY